MDLLIYGLAVVFVGLFAAGWLLLISSVILTASGVVVALPVIAMSRIRQHLGWAVTRSIEEGILCVEGLAGEVRLANRLHGGLARSWMEQVEAGLRGRASGSLGLALQDGGVPVSGMARHLAPEDWPRVAREFLLTE